MSLTNPNTPVSQQDLQDFYHKLLPYMGGSFGMIANKFSKGDLYSTDEKMIGQWTDGKPLYQKTIVSTLASQPASGTMGIKYIEIGASVEYGYVADLTIKDATTYLNAFYVKDDMATFVKAYIRADSALANPNTISVSNKAWFDYPCYITVRYTKTTDSPISIGDDTDYSTEEKIVGTWIDGKPIYQKTIDCNRQLIPSGAWTLIQNITINNVGNLVEANAMYVNNSNAPKKYATAFSINPNNTISVNRYAGADGSDSLPLVYITIQYTKTTD